MRGMRPRTRPAGRAIARLLAGVATVLAVAALAASCADDPSAVAPAAAATDAPGATATRPWTHQPDGSPSVREVRAEASLEFPPGVDYGEALARLFVATRDGRLPAEAVVREPLPVEVVYAEPRAGAGLRLSLTAPWGWVPGSGGIRPASIALPGSLSSEEAAAVARAAGVPGSGPLPADVRVDVPDLLPCQVLGADGGRPPCP